jgi:hypothetical protein
MICGLASIAGMLQTLQNFFSFAPPQLRRLEWIRKRERRTVDAIGYVSDRNNAVPTIFSWLPAMSPASHPA